MSVVKCNECGFWKDSLHVFDIRPFNCIFSRTCKCYGCYLAYLYNVRNKYESITQGNFAYTHKRLYPEKYFVSSNGGPFEIYFDEGKIKRWDGFPVVLKEPIIPLTAPSIVPEKKGFIKSLFN